MSYAKTVRGFNAMSSPPPLSIIMPCLDEVNNIRSAINDALKELDDGNIVGEVIVINDGSTDDSISIIKEKASTDKRVRVINKEKTEGIGKGFWTGVNVSKYEFVVLIPGDNENSPSEVLSFYHLVNDVDVVIPFILNAEVRSISRRFISSLYRLIINISFGTTLNYTNGIVIYNKAALQSVALRSSGFFYQTELLIKLLRRGFLYAEVPQFLSKRKGGKSKALTLRSFFELLVSFIRLIVDVQILGVEGFSLSASDLPVTTRTYQKYVMLEESGKLNKTNV